MTRLQIFLAILAPQLLMLVGLVIRSETIRQTGTQVVLRVEPYDPMHPFMGRFVRTPLEIERLEESAITFLDALPEEGQTVYVGLVPGEPVWEARFLTPRPPEPSANLVFLRGEFVRSEAGTIWLELGHDEYYIPHDADDPSFTFQADGIERAELALVLSVDSSGTAVTEDLLVDGQPFLEWNATVQAEAEAEDER